MGTNTKKAEALEALRSASSSLLEDYLHGYPQKNIHTHLHTAMTAITDFIAAEAGELLGGHARSPETTDHPTTADPEKYPGGAHRRDPYDQIIEERSGLFGKPGPKTNEGLIFTPEETDDLIAAMEEDQGYTEREERREELRKSFPVPRLEEVVDLIYSHTPRVGIRGDCYDTAHQVIQYFSQYPPPDKGTMDEERETLLAEQEFEERVRGIVAQITYKERSDPAKARTWKFEVERDKTFGDRLYIQVRHYRPDAHKNLSNWGSGGKRYLTRYMTDREIINVIAGAYEAYEIHEMRKWFKYRGKAIFSPHINADTLVEIADTLDIRDA